MYRIEELNRIEDPVKKRAFFIAILSEEIKKRGGSPPILVGGMALELYTQGSYTTGDIDIKAPKEPLEEILQEWGFTKKGRVWFNEILDIYIDWLGGSLDEGPEAEERANKIIVGEGLEIKIISIEDLIIDRLNAYKWWNDEDSLLWVKVLLKVKEAMGETPDKDYLKRRAKEEKVEDIIENLID
ncbi:MAG: hypothetical protein N2257_05590 [Thermodesulfovibrionales bacterium]|nr:hypothetical protein [Thermodesulfovibrionales bacterium]